MTRPKAMTNQGHHTPYAQLARRAGRELGMADTSPAAVEQNDKARQLRDRYVAEFERRLSDVETYTLDELTHWLRDDLGCELNRSSVYRARLAVIDKQARIGSSAMRAKMVMDLLSKADVQQLAGGSNRLAMQVIFESLVHLPGAALTEMSNGDIIKLVDSLGRLQKNTATASLDGVRLDVESVKLDELRKVFDESARKAVAGSGDGKLDQARIDQIRRDVFGG